MSAQVEQSLKQRYVLPETILLMVIGSIDLLSTIYLVATGQAREANPLFAQLLHMGPWAFVAFKAVFLAGPLAIAESARNHNEPFVRSALRMGIILYLGFYAIAFARANAFGLLTNAWIAQ
jgi:hypothetical protein